jgi:NAD(P)-dependent dehydrogenase (short-subunit alcohol dehydrogenase family)
MGDGVVAVVTGAASGMGEAVSRRLAAAGTRVAMWDVDIDRTEANAKAIQDSGGTARAYHVDVGSNEMVERATAALENDLGLPRVLACCAGTSHRSPLLEANVDDWRRVVATNLDGPFFCIRSVGRLISKAGGGSIVVIASTAGVTGFANRPAYVASKSGAVGLTRAAALDLAAHGIRVNAIAPGPIDTPMLRHFLKVDSDAERDMASRTPMRRLGRVDEIADLALYLLSDQASYVTGQVIACDGGLLVNGFSASPSAT